jgi:hypothetical protein
MDDIPKDDVTHMTFLGLENNIKYLVVDGLFYYHRGLIGQDEISKPILVLLHGYPQT